MESIEDSSLSHIINDLKHYSKTIDIPQNLRDKILRTKLTALVRDLTPSSLDKEAMSVINRVLIQLQRDRNCAIKDVLTTSDSATLLELVTNSLRQSLAEIPEFILRMIHEYVISDGEVSSSILVQIIELGEREQLNNFKMVLSYVLKNRGTNVNEDFTKELFASLKEQKKINLSYFEDFTNVVTHMKASKFLINNELVTSFVRYVETLFENSAPEMHEYKDLDKSLYRLQKYANQLISECLCNIDLPTKLRLLKFKTELNSVSSEEDDTQKCKEILKNIYESDKDFQSLERALSCLAESDESFAEHLLLKSASAQEDFANLHSTVRELILNSGTKYSANMRWKASFSKLLELQNCTEEDLVEKALGLFDTFSNEELDASQALADAMQVYLCTTNSRPNDTFATLLLENFQSKYDSEFTVHLFKHMIDKAIDVDDNSLAYALFQESLRLSSAHWSLQGDPLITRTLNRLIVSVCKYHDQISDAFPKFRKIKQHMTSQVSVEAVTCLAHKMLKEECVGDTIEMLKRELPQIGKSSAQKLPVTPLCYRPYRELFDLLHNFVITYDGEETHETNWVLYGELHKYFHVPFETYLPALKFFCKVDRLNAALVIFRQIKMLHDIHGSQHVNLPPLREIYMFLLRTFGDKLYEEGVVEIHEYLKMDIDIERQDIELQNSILNAYSNLQNVGKVRDLFLSISSDSKLSGGINEETIQIMIKTYTYSDMLYVKKFWNNLSQFGVFPNHDVYKQYVIAHTYHGFIEDAVKLVEEIDDYNLEFTTDMLLAMYNYCLDPIKQQKIGEWAKNNHEEMWTDLSSSGLLKSASPYLPERNLLVLPKK